MTSQAMADRYNMAQKASKMAKKSKRDFLLLFSLNIYGTKDGKTKLVVKK